jgi:hypothetical protein
MGLGFQGERNFSVTISGNVYKKYNILKDVIFYDVTFKVKL